MLKDIISSPGLGKIEPLSLPYIIAEAGVNHEGDFDLAKRLIDEAKEGGADAIKFQAYRAESLASKVSPAYWDQTKERASNQFELFRRYDKFWKKEFELLKDYCDAVQIDFLCTPFDLDSATFLNDLMEAFKISSSDITNKVFIDFICNFKKPVLLSTGASNEEEIREAEGWILGHGNPLALLHCVLNYPTQDRDAHLGRILTLREKFPRCCIGYSDHTLPKEMRTLETAWLLGAKILEKHFTFDKTLPGNDHYHAMDKNDLKCFRSNLLKATATLGDYSLTSLESESLARKNARRSLVACRDIPEGKPIEPSDLTFKRPAFGVAPKDLDKVLGKRPRRTILADETLYWELLDDARP